MGKEAKEAKASRKKNTVVISGFPHKKQNTFLFYIKKFC